MNAIDLNLAIIPILVPLWFISSKLGRIADALEKKNKPKA
jgi:hypothetical protein